MSLLKVVMDVHGWKNVNPGSVTLQGAAERDQQLRQTIAKHPVGVSNTLGFLRVLMWA
jgi:hypothetical protein